MLDGDGGRDEFYDVENFIGSAFDDRIIGLKDASSIIDGGAGNDTIFGQTGDDTIYGGDGNDFIYGEDKKILGVDSENLMAQAGGKVIQVNAMGLEGEIHVIGDGFTDYELKAKGPANRFFAFTENVRRDNVCELADSILKSFNDYVRLVRD